MFIINTDGSVINSYVKNCIIEGKNEQRDCMFQEVVLDNGQHIIVCAIDGYAIIPIEEYSRLKVLDSK